MIGALLVTVGLASFAAVANAECANACNGHGICNAYDMCQCNRNWQAADCSERVCMFGLAHVDTPKGDLNMNGVVQSPNLLLVDNSYAYPFGTTEQFPQMQDSDLQELTDSAHYYMECSNKGKCDRTTGECQCYDGYDGVACQRASCPGFPNSCSGHGICKTIEQLAFEDHGNVYKLWDRKSTMGCSCDPGYTGPDCSQRVCKYGVDPLYLDDVATVKASVYEFATLTTGHVTTTSDPKLIFTNGEEQVSNGHWAIRFFDNHGEDWVTDPIEGGADCDEVLAALYALPNRVIPDGTLLCTMSEMYNNNERTFNTDHTHIESDNINRHPAPIIYKMAWWEARLPNGEGELSDFAPRQAFAGSNDTSSITVSGAVYRIKFLGNPGKLFSPEIEIYLDGKRPSLVSSVDGGKVITKVWTDGQQGENVDYFADHCDGVTVTINNNSPGRFTSFLDGLTATEKNLLKRCLGDADGNDDNNVDVYNWDKGSKRYPHIIKLVRTVTTQYDGGYYAVVWYDTNAPYDDQTHTEGTFRLLNQFLPPDHMLTDNYDVYTTKGVLALTTDQAEATFGFASKYIYTTNVTYDMHGFNTSAHFDGDISCENSAKSPFVHHCLNKTDLFTVLNWEFPSANPRYINLYTAERIYTGNYKYSVQDRFANMLPNRGMSENKELHYMTHFITTDLATNWAASIGNFTTGGVTENNDFGKPQFHVYKFFPAKESSYEYVAECSNRGLCDTDSGICQCFPGYTNDNCDTQSSLAV